MKFDINEFIYAFEEGDLINLRCIAFSYEGGMAYVYEKDYALMELLLNVIIDRIYDMPSKEVQGDYFDVLDYGIGGYSAVYENVYHCVDRLVKKIATVSMNDWELAETLRIIGGTVDRRYYDLIEKYKDHEDAYVREVVEEYFYDLRMEEEGQYK